MKNIFLKLVRLILISLGLSLVYAVSTASAASYSWYDAVACGNTWNDIDCWRVYGTATPASSYPNLATDVAYFQYSGSDPAYNQYAYMNVSVSIQSINIQASHTAYVYMLGANTVTTSGDVTVTAGQLQGATGGTFNIGGNLNLNGGNFHSNTGVLNVTLDIILSSASSIFTGSTGNVTVSSDVLITSGTFNSTSTYLFIQNNFTVGASGVFNPSTGTVYFNGSGNSSINVNSTEDFYNLTLNKTSTTYYLYFSDATGDVVNVTGSLILGLGKLVLNNNAELVASGTLSWLSTFGGNYSTSYLGYLTIKTTSNVVIPNGQTNIPSLRIDNTNLSTLTVSTAGSTAMSFQGYFEIAAGQLTGATFDNAGLSPLTFSRGVLLNNGIFRQGGSAPLITITNDLTLSGGGDYYAEGGDLNVGGSIISNNTGSFFYAGSSLSAVGVTGDVTFSGDMYMQGGDLTVGGNVLLDNSAAYLSGAAGSVFDITGSLTLSGGDVSLGGAVLSVTGSVILNNSLSGFAGSSGDITISGFLTITSGDFGSTTGVLYIQSSMSVGSTATFTHNNGSVVFNGAINSTLDVNDTQDFYNLTIDKTNLTNYLYLNDSNGDTVNVSGLLTLGNGKLVLVNGSNLVANGTLNWTSLFDGNLSSSYLGYLTINTTADVSIPSGQINIPSLILNNLNKSNLVVSTASSTSMNFQGYFLIAPGTGTGASFVNSGGADLTFEKDVLMLNGTLNLGSAASLSHIFSGPTSVLGGNFLMGGSAYIEHNGLLTIDGSGNYTVSNKATINMGASAMLNVINGVFDATIGSIISYDTAVDAINLDGGTFYAPSADFYLSGGLDQEATASFVHNNGIITFAGSTNSFINNASTNYYYDIYVLKDTLADEIQLSSDLYLDGDLNIAVGTFKFMSPNTLYLAQDFINAGGASATFVHGNGSVVLNGLDQAISGSTTFYNLAKSVLSSSVLVFESGSSQTIAGNLTLNGVYSYSTLYLRSSIFGNYWYINPQGTSTIAYVDVHDSNNLNATKIDATDGTSIDAGNNVNWDFGDYYYWVGSYVDCDGSWNDMGCWSHTSGGTGGISTLPDVNSLVVFDGSDSANCTIDTTVSVNTLYVDNYAGTILGNTSYSVTTSSEFSQWGGTISMNGATVTSNGSVNFQGGTYNAGSNGNLIISGDLNYNTSLPQAVNINFSGASTLEVGGDFYFGNSLSSGTFTAPTSIILSRDLTVAAGTSSVFDANLGTVHFDSSNPSVLTNVSGILFNNLDIDKTSGLLTLLSNLDIYGNLTITSGELSAGSNTIYVDGSFENAGTFTAGTSTVDLGSGSQSIVGNTTFYNLTKSVSSPQTLTFAAGSTQIVTNDWTFAGASSNLLSLRSSSLSSYWYINPQGTRTISYIDVQDSNNLNASVINAVGTNSVDSLRNVNWKFSDDYYWVGYSLGCDGSWNDLDCWSHTDGGAGGVYYLPTASSYVAFTGLDSSNCTIDVTVDVNQWDMLAGYTGTITGNALYPITVGTNKYTQLGGTLNLNGSNFTTLSNSYISGGNFNSGTGILDFYNLRFNTVAPFNSVVNLSTASTVDMGYFIFGASAGGASGTFTAPSLMTISGSFGSYAGNTSVFNHNNGTVVFDADASYIYDGVDFNNLTINAGTFTLTSNLDVNGNLTIAGGTLTTGTNQINVYGNWVNSGGTFTSTGSVVLDGLSQSISGNNSFYNLSKSVSSAQTLTFTAGSTQTVLNDLSLTGFSNAARLYLVSSSVGNSWNINPQGARTILYIDVKDSTNLNATSINAIGTGSIDSGNNINWDFGNRYWVSGAVGCDGSWNDTDCWSFLSGGTGGVAIPVVGNNVYFDSAGTGNCLIDATVNVSAFDISTGYTGTITGNSLYSVSVATLYKYGGTFNLNGSNFVASSTVSLNGGSFNAGIGTFTTNYLSFNFEAPKNSTANFSSVSSLTVNNNFTFGSSAGGSFGTFTAPSSNMSIGENINTYAGNTSVFTANGGTVTLTGSTSSTYSYDSIDFYSLTINKSGGSLALSANLDVNWDLTISAGTLNAGANQINVYGNWVNSGGTLSSTGTVILDGFDQSISGNTSFYNLTKSSTGAKILTFAAGSTQIISNTLTLSGQELSLVSSSPGTRWNINPQGTRTLSVLRVQDSNNVNATAINAVDTNSTDLGNNVNWDFGNRYWVSGSVGCDASWNDTDCWSFASGGTGGAPLPGVTNNVWFNSGGTGNCAIDASVNVASIYFDTGYTGVVTGNALYSVGTGYFFQLAGTLNLNGSNFTNTNDYYLSGGTLNSGTSAFVTNNLLFNSFYTPKTGTANFASASSVTVNGNFTFGASGGGSSGTFTAPSSNMSIGGNINTYAGNTVVFAANGGTVTLTGATASAYVYDNIDFNNLTINKSGGSLVLSVNLDVNGNLTLAAGTLNAGANQINVYGNWVNSGGTLSSTGTVILDGTNQSISGNTSFYNLTKSTPGTILTFAASSTQTILNNLVLNGGYSNWISLVSSSPGTQWNIDPQGSRTVSYLKVQDSVNTNLTSIIAGTGSTDLGNNVNWDFGKRYWVSGAVGCDGSWNDTDCWSYTSGGAGGATLPDSTSTVYFDTGGTGNCAVDASFDVLNLYVQPGYTGTITGNAIYTSFAYNFFQYDGTVNLNGSNFGSSGFSLNGGVFNSGTGTFGASSFGYNVSAPKNATANFANSSSVDISFNFTFGSSAGGSSGTFTAPSSNMNITGSMASYAGNTSVFNANGGTVTLVGALGSSYNYDGFDFNNLTINKTNTLILGANLDVNGNLTLTAGTFNAGANQINVAGNWISSGGTFTSTGTVILDGVNQSISGSTSFYNLTKSVATAASLTFTAGSTQIVTNTLTLNGASGQLLSIVSSSPGVQWNINPQATRIVSYLNVQDSVNTNVTPILAGSSSVDAGNDVNWDFGNRYWVGSDLACDGSWNDTDCWSYASGGSGGATLPGVSHNVYFDSADTANCSIDTNVSVYGLNLETGYTGTITGNALYTVNVSNVLYQYDGVLNLNGSDFISSSHVYMNGGSLSSGTGSFSVGGFMIYNFYAPKTADMDFTGSSGVTFNNTFYFGSSTGGSSGTFTAPSTNLTFVRNIYSYAGNTLVFDANGGNITFSGNLSFVYGYDGFDFYDVVLDRIGVITLGANLNVTNDLTIIAGDLDVYGKILDVGGNLLISGGGLLTGASNLVSIVGNLTLDGGTLTTASGNVLDVNGNVALSSGTLVAVASQINVYGNWSNNGGTLSGTGTVNLDGTNQVVSGDTSFYNFTKSILTADTLTFAVSSIQTITNTLTLNGAVGQYLSLRSSSTGNHWNIDPQGTRNVSYLDVQDSHNINPTEILAGTGSIDSLNNLNWDFGDRYWVGSHIACDDNWSNSYCWSTSSGGNGGASVPSSMHTVYFDAGSATNPQINANVNVASIQLKNGFIYTITGNSTYSVTVDAFLQYGGTLNLNGSDLIVAANMYLWGGTFNSGASDISVGDIFFYSTNPTYTSNANFSNATSFSIVGNFEFGSIAAGSAGTFVAPASMSIGRDWTSYSENIYTFNANGGTVVFNTSNSSDYNHDVSVSFNNVTINRPSGDLVLSDNLDVNGNLTLSAGTLYTGTNSVSVAGSWVNSGGIFDSTGNVILDGGNQSISGNTSFYNLTKASATAVALIFEANSTQTILNNLTLNGANGQQLSLLSSSSSDQWDIDPQVNRDISFVSVRDSNNVNLVPIYAIGSGNVDLGNNDNWDFGDRYWVGSFAGCDGSWNDLDCWATRSGGKGGAPIPVSTNNVYFDSADTSNALIDVTFTVNKLYLESGYTGIITGNSLYSITVLDIFDQVAGTVNLNGSNFTTGSSALLNGGSFDAGTGAFVSSSLVFNYSAPKSANVNLGNVSSVTINENFYFGSNTGGGTGTLTAPSTNMYIIGTLLSYSGNTNVFDANNGTIYFSSPSIVSYAYNAFDFNNLVINKSTESLTLAANLNVNGNLILLSGTLNTGTYSINLAGNWINSGGTLSGAGNVILDGVNQSISGNTSFYNLTKSVASSATLTFDASSTQTITNNMIFEGAASQYLNLVSSSPSTQWNIDPQGIRTVSYLNVQDSVNINATTIDAVGSGSIDSGNNVKWDFGYRYWVGSYAGCDGTFDDTDCWANNSGGAGGFSVPDSTMKAIFDGGDTTACSIDSAVNVSGIWIETGYTGTITGNSSFAMTVGIDRLLQKGGTLNLNGMDMTNNDNFYVYGGSFVSGAADITMNDLFYNYSAPSTGSVNLSLATSVAVDGNFYFGNPSGGATGTFTAPSLNINISGDIHPYLLNSSTFASNNGTVTLVGADADYINGGFNFYNLVVNKTGIMTLGANLNVLNNLVVTVGTLNAGLGNVIDVAGNINLATGSSFVSVNQIYFAGNWNNTGGVLSGNSTVILDGVGQVINGSTTFNNFTKIVASADTLTFDTAGTQTFIGTLTLNGASSNLLTLIGDTASTYWHINPQGARAVDYVDVAYSYNDHAVAIQQTNSVDSGNTVNWDFGDRYWVGSDVSCSGTWSDSGCWAAMSGGLGGVSVPVASNDVYFDSGDTSNCSVNVSTVMNDFVMQSGYTGTITANSSGLNFVANSFTQNSGSFALGNYKLNIANAMTLNSGGFSVGATSTINVGTDLLVNTLGSKNAVVSFANSASVVVTANFNLGVSGSTGSFVAPSSYLSANSMDQFTTSSTSFAHNNGEIRIVGGGTSNLRLKDGLYNFVLNKSLSSETLNVLSNVAVANDFNVTNGIFNVNGNDMLVGGDWIMGATGDYSYSQIPTVTLNGGSQAIYGSTTFYNLTKEVISVATLSFEAGERQTIVGDMVLTGISGDMLSLRSTVNNSQAEIDPQGGRTVAYLDVQDNFNVNVLEVNAVATGSVDSLNNTNWLFGSGADSDAIIAFGNKMFAGIFDTALDIYTKVVPYSSAWASEAQPSDIDRIKSMISYKGVLYAGGNNGKIYKRSEAGFDLYSVSDALLGQYVHLAMTFDKDVASGVKLYINGVLDASMDYASLLGINASDLRIGTSYGSTVGGSNATGEEFFKGEIDEFRVSSAVRDVNYLGTAYNNVSSPNTFVTLGAEEYKPTQEGGGVSFTSAMGSFTSSAVTSNITGGSLIITGNGAFAGDIDMALGAPPIEDDAVLQWISALGDYFYFSDSSPTDGFKVSMYLSSSDNGNFVYTGDSLVQDSLPASNLNVFGAYNLGSSVFVPANKTVDGTNSTLIIDSANSCDTAENLGLYDFSSDLTTGDFGMAMSNIPQNFLTARNTCLVEGKFKIDGLELLIPAGSIGGSYVSMLHVVLTDGY